MKNEVRTPYSFIFGGNAEFSIQNLENGQVYRYLVKKAKDNDHMFFVYVQDGRNWSYSGYLLKHNDGSYRYDAGNKGNYGVGEPPIRGLMYALHYGNRPLPAPMSMYHHCKCALCGKTLKDAESVERGFGPECWKRVTGK